ncbi:MAG: hypothetical protein CMG66_00925 [Candidatus Marinimicrobia bacterium]|nr:hypothetical protein [Candidatus Neomarinimicrobiota bacterium]|tara:strand:- start:10750 stop:11442 length:693 start_codon:yes stop_codon:yes gene_type:complete
MNIVIVSNGPGLKDVVDKFGHSSEWIPSAINDSTINYKILKAYEGETCNVKDYDAFIITGSKYSVYDNFEWISNLKIFIDSIISKNKPILGICFGHQILAECLGGKVEKNKLGWELGSYKINLTDNGLIHPLFKGVKDGDIVYESHQDVVSLIPDNAIELAYTEKANQSFAFNDNVFGVQFHPEFSYDVTRELMDIRVLKGISIDSDKLEESLNSKNILVNFINIVRSKM